MNLQRIISNQFCYLCFRFILFLKVHILNAVVFQFQVRWSYNDSHSTSSKFKVSFKLWTLEPSGELDRQWKMNWAKYILLPLIYRKLHSHYHHYSEIRIQREGVKILYLRVQYCLFCILFNLLCRLIIILHTIKKIIIKK